MIAQRFILATAAAGALAVAGCGSGNRPGVATTPASTNPVGEVASTPAPAAPTTTTATPTTTAAAPATTATAPPPAPVASGPVTISMKNIAFTPNAVTVKAGTKITWSMDEPIQHNVVADSGATFKSALLSQGQTFVYTPKKAGVIKYECTLHPGMVGTITVQ
jgi:plastocyanin